MESPVCCIRRAICCGCRSESFSRLPRICSTTTSSLATCLYLMVSECAAWSEGRPLAKTESNGRFLDCPYHVRCVGSANCRIESGMSLYYFVHSCLVYHFHAVLPTRLWNRVSFHVSFMNSRLKAFLLVLQDACPCRSGHRDLCESFGSFEWRTRACIRWHRQPHVCRCN